MKQISITEYMQDIAHGKADIKITSLLPVGKKNAISTEQLMILSGCHSARELQQRIARERSKGAVICSGSGRGYWLPQDRKEIEEFCKTMESRAKNIFNATKSARKVLEMPEGQQDIKK